MRVIATGIAQKTHSETTEPERTPESARPPLRPAATGRPLPAYTRSSLAHVFQRLPLEQRLERDEGRFEALLHVADQQRLSD